MILVADQRSYSVTPAVDGLLGSTIDALMPAMVRSRWAILTLGIGFGSVLQGCSKDKIDLIQSGGGCAAEAGPGSVGRCPDGVSACKVGFADLDGTAANGCETVLQAAGAPLAFKVANGGMAQWTINDFPLNTDIIGGWIAVKGAACTARMGSPCTYELLALQLQSSEFVFDGMSFAEGLLTLPKPMTVTDDGEGLMVPAGSGIIASFLVSGKKRVVSLGRIEGGIAIQMTAERDSTTTTGHGLHVAFGGCTMDALVAANGHVEQPARDAGGAEAE